MANENVPGEVVASLRLKGHDVAWVRTDMPGASDDTVLHRALSDKRLLLTFDKDFGELVFRRGRKASNGIVLFRISTPSPEAVVSRMISVLESRADWIGMFSVIEDSRVRMIALPE